MEKMNRENIPTNVFLTERQWGEVLAPMGLKEDDIRTKKLRNILPAVPANPRLSVPEVVTECLKAMKSINLSDEERKLLAEVTTLEIDEVIASYSPRLAALIRESEKDAATIISVGCGSSGHLENQLDQGIRKELGNTLSLKWIGIETSDKRTEDSFFRQHSFLAVAPSESPQYSAMIPEDCYRMLIGNFSYHHLGKSFADFLQQCRGLDRVALLEQPVSKENWSDAAHRTAKIAYDMLVNEAIDPDWIKQVEISPDAFQVNYLLENEIPMDSHIMRFPNVVPKCAIIDFKP